MDNKSTKFFKLKYAVSIAAILSLLVVLQQYIDYVISGYDFEFSWIAVSSKVALNYFLWAILSPVLFKVIEKTLVYANVTKVISQHVMLSILVASFHRIGVIRLYDIVYYLQTGYFREFFIPSNQVQLGAGFFSSFIQYWIIVGLLMAVSYYSKFLEKKKELSTAQLNALKMQLRPHFLFNTLNSIASLIDIDRKKAQKMLSQLGFLLREILEHDDKDFITLRDELEYLKTYLAIEQTRFQDRMIVTTDIDEKLFDAKVPSLLLQPLIENAVKHGISTCSDEGEIKVFVKSVADDKLEIQITNSVGKVNVNNKGYGIGIQNIEKRLTQLYSNNFEFEFGVNGEHTYSSKIVIPYTKSNL